LLRHQDQAGFAPTLSPLNCTPWSLSLELKFVSLKMTSHLHRESRLKMRETLPPLLPLFLRGLWLKHKGILIWIFISINPDLSENMKCCCMVTRPTCMWKYVDRILAEALLFIKRFSPFQSKCHASLAIICFISCISAISAVRLETASDESHAFARRVNSYVLMAQECTLTE
jgi:hypothetical protein